MPLYVNGTAYLLCKKRCKGIKNALIQNRRIRVFLRPQNWREKQNETKFNNFMSFNRRDFRLIAIYRKINYFHIFSGVFIYGIR